MKKYICLIVCFSSVDSVRLFHHFCLSLFSKREAFVLFDSGTSTMSPRRDPRADQLNVRLSVNLWISQSMPTSCVGSISHCPRDSTHFMNKSVVRIEKRFFCVAGTCLTRDLSEIHVYSYVCSFLVLRALPVLVFHDFLCVLPCMSETEQARLQASIQGSGHSFASTRLEARYAAKV